MPTFVLGDNSDFGFEEFLQTLIDVMSAGETVAQTSNEFIRTDGQISVRLSGWSLDYEDNGAEVDLSGGWVNRISLIDANGVNLGTITNIGQDADEFWNSLIDAGDGTDPDALETLFLGQEWVIKGSGASDTFNGTSGNDTIVGRAGDDDLSGADGNDWIGGGSGHDTLAGGSGCDTLSGGSGNDSLNGGAGSDVVYAGWGNDVVTHDESENDHSIDRYYGQFGYDTLRLNVSQETFDSHAFQCELAWFQKMQDYFGSSSGYFSTLGVKFSSFEAIEVSVEAPSMPSTFGFGLPGLAPSDFSGQSVASVGDLNGDGIADIMITSSAGNRSDSNIDGLSHVVYGGQDFGASVDLSILNQDGGLSGITIPGVDGNGTGFLTSVAAAGDVNGDGIDDMLIGVPSANRFGEDGGNIAPSGSTYVVFGGQSLPSTLDLAALGQTGGPAGFKLVGIDLGDRSGTSVSSAGDFNNDGIDDILVGAKLADREVPSSFADEAGETYLIYGGQDFNAEIDLSTLGQAGETNGVTFLGVGGDSFSGGSVASIGDVNGDGIDDILIGAGGATIRTTELFRNIGESYVVFGGQDLSGEVDLATLGETDGLAGFKLMGSQAGESSGIDVANAGDFNGDGVNDIAISTDENNTYVVFGGQDFDTIVELAALGQADGVAGVTLAVDTSDSLEGIAVSSAGDVNGDGIDDLIIGTDQLDGGPGTAYLVMGGQDFDANVDLTDLGSSGGLEGFVLNAAGDGGGFGFSVASAGDVNDDGVDDLLIGSPTANTLGGDFSGESYVIYGGDEMLKRFDAADGDRDGQIDLSNLGLNPTEVDFFL